ncbi:MAG TPA: hypothetical protein GXX46_00495 [Peptococcaceae bacterium]|nr:hypothetical protein [Peptococcaceae bacterium]
MINVKKFLTVLAVFMLSLALLAGCGTTEGDTQNGGNSGVVEKGEPEGGSGQEAENKDVEQNEAQSPAVVTTDGTLKAVDAEAGTITITTQDGNELVLKATEESKILFDDSQSSDAQLADMIGSEVNVEYQEESKNVTSIRIK